VALTEFVFSDESGTHGGSWYCIVGGYRAKPRQWKMFKNEWDGILKSEGIEEFHSNVFFNRKVITNPAKNPYWGWSEKRAAHFLNALLDAIQKRQLDAVGSGLDVLSFNRLTYGERYVLSHHDWPGRRNLT